MKHFLAFVLLTTAVWRSTSGTRYQTLPVDDSRSAWGSEDSGLSDSAGDLARDSGKDSAGDTSDDEAKDSAGNLAKDSAGDLAKDSAGDLAKDSAGDLAKDSAGDLAKDSAGDFAKDSAGDLAKDSAGDSPSESVGVEIPVEEVTILDDGCNRKTCDMTCKDKHFQEGKCMDSVCWCIKKD